MDDAWGNMGKLLDLDDLNEDYFTWDRYCGRMDIDPARAWDFMTNKPRLGTVVYGKIDGTRLPKPREYSLGLLVFREGDTFWFHVPDPRA
jgi:hypothetical protein